MIKQLYLIIFILWANSCDMVTGSGQKEASYVRDAEGKIVSGTVKEYKNDVLYAIRNVENYKLEGKTTIYQKDGKTLKSEIYYKKGIKHGVVKAYYKEGSLYRTYNYNEGLMDGEQKRFRKNGKLSSIAIYRNGEPNNSLKEYLIDGQLKKKYPTIKISTEDKMLLNGQYKVHVRMSDNSKKVQFYLGKLDKDGFIKSNAVRMGSKGDGFFTVTYTLALGQFVIEKLNIIAKTKTRQGNYYLTTKSYNVAIENRAQ